MKKETIAVVSLVIALFVLLFGNNIFQQVTGRSIFASIPSSTPLFKSNTTPTPDYPHVFIENQLVRPAKIYINNNYKNTIDPDETTLFILDSFPATVTFEVVNISQDADNMTGSWLKVTNGSRLAITNAIGNEFFFFVSLDNNTDTQCDIYIDKGYQSEKHAGILLSNQKNISMGYYRLYSNSNVSLQCADGKGYWWGIQPGQQEPEASIIEIVQPASGLLKTGISP